MLICADTQSSDPVELAGKIARDRGRVIAIGAFGLDMPRKPYYDKELTFKVSRSYGPGRYDPKYEEQGIDYPAGYVRWTEGRNLQSVLDLQGAGLLDVHPLITHRIGIEDAVRAYDLITGKLSEPFLGVLLTYPQVQPEVATQRTVKFAESISKNDNDLPGLGCSGRRVVCKFHFPALDGKDRRGQPGGDRVWYRFECPLCRQEVRLPVQHQ